MKEVFRNTLALATIVASSAVGVRASEAEATQASYFDNKPTISLQQENTNEFKQDLNKLGLTFMGAAWVAGVCVFGYRMSDGTKNDGEKNIWLYLVPAANAVGTSLVLASKWV